MKADPKNISRRSFVKKTAAAGLAAAVPIFASPFSITDTSRDRKVIVLGIDGMDPGLTRHLLERGQMPNLKRLTRTQPLMRLGTTLPPQSPVAWSAFISGTHPGKNGIYDFIHRNPATFTPYLSTSRSISGSRRVTLGKWSIPLQSGHIDLLRRGPVFWHGLLDHDIPVYLFKMPSNFPVTDHAGDITSVSGMGTPDLLGTYGTFTLFVEGAGNDETDLGGGRRITGPGHDHRFDFTLTGPPNELRSDRAPVAVPFTIHRDPYTAAVKISLPGHEGLYREGEWSDWIPIAFDMLPPFSHLHGMIRIYIQKVHPTLQVYCSPINVDPADPDLPIAVPETYTRDLQRRIGRFYTQGFPEDTKALSRGVFSDDEFLAQSKIVFAERKAAFHDALDHFHDGLFFYYFSSVDQNSHMLLRTMNPSHPLYAPNATPEVKDAVPWFYRNIDEIIGETLSRVDNRTTVMILSDHGFAPFTREFNVSTWLVENGYTAVTDPEAYHRSSFFDYVDWPETQAYALGLNSLYLNLKGREMNGSLLETRYRSVKKHIMADLRTVRDPKTGARVISHVYDGREVYQGPYRAWAPDIVIGYNRGYRISDQAALGGFPRGIITDRTDKWSSDHCMDPSHVPGVLISNRRITSKHPGLWDLGPSILDRFGIAAPADMDGTSIY